MARSSDKNTENNEQSITYYSYLWKERLSWTRHVIPIRFKEPNSGYFLEGYISPPSSCEEGKIIEVDSAYLFTSSINTFKVDIKEIYPSKRKLYKTQNETEVVQTDFLTQYDPPDPSPLNYSNIFNTFPNTRFTINELQTIVNSTIERHLISFLIEDGEKLCLISNQIEKAYRGMNKPTINFGNKKMDVSQTISELIQSYQSCNKCPLGSKRDSRNGSVVCSRIAYQADKEPTPGKYIMLIGEAPGLQEEQNKMPFFPEAPAGSVLDKVLKAAKINLEQCYFTNAVWCRPEPKDDLKVQNGTPTKEEIVACNSRLKNEIAIVNPKIIVLLGKSAYTSVYGKEPKTVLNMIGWQSGSTSKIYFLPHPSYVVRELSFADPAKKKEIKQKYLDHFIEINKVFNELE